MGHGKEDICQREQKNEGERVSNELREVGSEALVT